MNPPVLSDLDPHALAATVRGAPGLRAKRALDLLARLPQAPDGDDAAVIARGEEKLLLCGEAVAPTLLRDDPFAAGAAAVVTNVADIRAMGGRPLALLDTLISPDRAHAERVLDGLAWAADLHGVAVVGGHLTLGGAPALSAFCTGTARTVLRSSAARPGDALLATFCLQGRLRDTTEPPIFTSLRDRPAELLREDGEALVEVAEAGLCHAARDVSMPGVAGSLLQLLELSGCGATLELDRLPRPPDVALERWLLAFPSFGFVLAATPAHAEAACAAFERRGLACARCGEFDDSGVLRLAGGGAVAEVWDLAAAPLTRLGPG